MRIRFPWPKPVKGADPIEFDLEAAKVKYRMESTSANTAEFEPIKLQKTEPSTNEQSRKILGARAITNTKDPKSCLQVRLIYQRKHNKGTVDDGREFRDLERIKLSDIKAGQEVQIDLDSSQTAQLAEHLQNLYAIAAGGVEYGIKEKVVVSTADADFLEQLGKDISVSRERREQALQMLRGTDPVTFSAVALWDRQQRHQSALDSFEEHMAKLDWSEDQWEVFFRNNKWIFGHGLAYQFLSEVQEQAVYGGQSVTGKGYQKGDHLMATEGACRFTVLVEVKTPQADLLGDKYRNGAYLPGEDVAGGIAQLQANCRKWTVEGAKSEENRELEEAGIYTVQPKGILIVGHSGSLDSLHRRTSFELLRQCTHNPEVITFDELLARAKYIVEHELDMDGQPGDKVV